MEYQTERIQTCQTKEKVTDQFYLNQDLNVPDAKPDVAYTYIYCLGRRSWRTCGSRIIM